MIDATFSVCSVIQNAEHDRERVANSCPNLSEILLSRCTQLLYHYS